MKKTAIAASVFFLFTGCRTVAVHEATVPEIGATSTAGVGEHLLTQGYGFNTASIFVPEDQKMGDVVILKGKYASSGAKAEYAGFRGVNLRNIATGTETRGSIYLFSKDKGTRNACISRTVCGELNYSLDRNTTIGGKKSFQRTLIYSGKIGDKITLGYREFTNDFARPAFSNDVVYDLSASTIVGYKGARLEVLQANNTEITYKVIADFQ